ncbi:hypothetical protein B0O99DRAFT_622784, partial [Bisporella sp. PMI_857]
MSMLPLKFGGYGFIPLSWILTPLHMVRAMPRSAKMIDPVGEAGRWARKFMPTRYQNFSSM